MFPCSAATTLPSAQPIGLQAARVSSIIGARIKIPVSLMVLFGSSSSILVSKLSRCLPKAFRFTDMSITDGNPGSPDTSLPSTVLESRIRPAHVPMMGLPDRARETISFLRPLEAISLEMVVLSPPGMASAVALRMESTSVVALAVPGRESRSNALQIASTCSETFP